MYRSNPGIFPRKPFPNPSLSRKPESFSRHPGRGQHGGPLCSAYPRTRGSRASREGMVRERAERGAAAVNKLLC